MDDVTMIAKLDDETTVYVSPVHDHTYHEHVEDGALGNATGYFISRERRDQFEILGKASSLEAAREIFSLLTAGRAAS